MATIESGKLKLECSPTDMEKVLKYVWDICNTAAIRKGVCLKFVKGENVPSQFLCDFTRYILAYYNYIVFEFKVHTLCHRLSQILVNLIGNAVKFTGKGTTVTVAVKVARDVTAEEVKEECEHDRNERMCFVKKEFPEHKILAFSVCDEGIGIPRDKLGLIFETFTQADVTIARKFGTFCTPGFWRGDL
jgi:signal transduction histidine kinase